MATGLTFTLRYYALQGSGPTDNFLSQEEIGKCLYLAHYRSSSNGTAKTRHLIIDLGWLWHQDRIQNVNDIVYLPRRPSSRSYRILWQDIQS